MPKLLLVDDEPDCEAISSALELSGLSVQTCGDGKEAVACYRKERVDLVFCDLKLPGQDGLAVLEEIKAMDPWATVIIVTAYGSVDAAAHALRLGAYDFLEKPLTFSKIQKATRRALDHRRALREMEAIQGKPGSVADIPARLTELEELKTDFLSMITSELGRPLKILRDELNLVDAGFYGKELPRQDQFLNQFFRAYKLLDRLMQSCMAFSVSHGKARERLRENPEKP